MTTTTDERRAALSGILAAFGGGAVLLSACLPEDAGSERVDEEFGSAADALSTPTAVTAVDTIANVRAIDVANSTNYPEGKLVAVLGHSVVSDGGGGLFRLERAPGSPPDDDNGVTIEGTVGAGSGGGPGAAVEPRWFRVYSGPVNIRWFGARSGINSAPAIQAAIDLVADDDYNNGSPAAVYVPAGEYTVHSSIVLPRLGGENRGMTIFGDGVNMSVITTNQAMAAASPVITFEDTAASAWDVTVKSLTLIHANRGYGFAHFGDNVTCRLHRLALSDLFVSTFVDDDDFGPYSPVYLESTFDSRLERLVLMGGECMLFLNSCARCTVTDLATYLGQCQANGIRIDGGGTHTIIRPRIETCGTASSTTEINTGILIQKTASNEVPSHIVIQQASFEGKFTKRQIWVKHGEHIVLLDCHFATASRVGSMGLVLDDGAHDVRITGGALVPMYYANPPNSQQSLYVAANASDVSIDTAMAAATDDLDADFAVAAGAKRIRIRAILTKTGHSLFEKFVGMVSEPGAASGHLKLQTIDGPGGEFHRMPANTALTHLDGGYEGQRVTLLSNGTASLSNAGNVSLSTAGTFAPANSVSSITLYCDGSTWPSVPTSDETDASGYLCTDGRRMVPRSCPSHPKFLFVTRRRNRTSAMLAHL